LPLVLVGTYRKLRELGQRAVEYDIGRLGHQARAQTAGRIVDPERAITAIPAIAAGDGRRVVGRGDDGHTVAPALAVEKGTATRHLFDRQTICRHELHRSPR